MGKQISKKLKVTMYAVFVLLCFVVAFLYKDGNQQVLSNNIFVLDEGWVLDGEEITLPYNDQKHFVITNTLPLVYDQQSLILKCRYDELTVYINGQAVFKSENPHLNDKYTNAGCKQLSIPLSQADSMQKITLDITLHDSLYSTSLQAVYIGFLSDYILKLILDNTILIIICVILLIGGFIEIILASKFLVRKVKIRRQFTFEALFYTGLFSISLAVWTFLNTRIPGMIRGNMTATAIVGYISFLLMPFLFMGMLRAIEDCANKYLNIIFHVEAVLVLVLIVLSGLAIIDFDNTTIFAHIMDAIAIISALILAIIHPRKTDSQKEINIMVVCSGIFVAVSTFAILGYIIDRESNFILFFLIALTIYLVAQVLVMLNRIGIRAEEELDFKRAKEYAYEDDLTGVGNRRRFFAEINNELNPSNDFTVIYMDVNRLKYYNDKHGHDVGDELLLGASECIELTFKNARCICRMGGDEFAVIIEASREETEKLIKTFKAKAKAWKGPHINELSVAVGYARFEDYKENTLAELAGFADDGMFEDKKLYYDETGYERRGDI